MVWDMWRRGCAVTIRLFESAESFLPCEKRNLPSAHDQTITTFYAELLETASRVPQSS